MDYLSIRYFEKIMRNANAQYPRISPYRVMMRSAQKYVTPAQKEWIVEIGRTLDAYRMRVAGKSLTEIFESDIRGLKNNRLGDCGESSALSMGALFANGYTDGNIARLIFEGQARDLSTGKIVSKRNFDTTHECVVLNLAKNACSENPKSYGKNSIVMDAWEGFCANISEAFKKYFDIFLSGTYKHIDKTNNVELSYKPRFYFYKHNEEFNEKTVEKFKKLFPDLII